MSAGTGSTPTRAATFLNAMGINTHINFWGANSAYKEFSSVASALKYLGIKYVRDAVPVEGTTLPLYETLAAKGYKFDFVVSSVNFNKQGNFQVDINRLSAFAEQHKPAIAAIEGFNEINTWPVFYNGSDTGSDLPIGRDLQALLYHQLQSSASLAGIPVLNLTVGGLSATQAASLGDLSTMADYGNWHVYFANGEQPAANIASGIASAKALDPQDPVQITETNNYTAVSSTDGSAGGVSERTQAKLDLNLLFDAAKAGVARTYLYELFDNGLTPATTFEGSLGLFHSDGTPKPAATAIHNLRAILADSGVNAANFVTQPLDISISGMPAYWNSLLLQKADGRYDLAVWAEPDIWNEKTRSEIPVPATTVTLRFGGTFGTVKVYDPLSGTTPIASATATSTVSVAVADHPIIIALNAPQPSSSPTPLDAGKVVGAPFVKDGRDARAGDARRNLLPGGPQVGDSSTASAFQGIDQSSLLNPHGGGGRGTHPVEMRFLRDHPKDAANTDHRPFVEGAVWNSQALPQAPSDVSEVSSTHKLALAGRGTLSSSEFGDRAATVVTGPIGHGGVSYAPHADEANWGAEPPMLMALAKWGSG